MAKQIRLSGAQSSRTIERGGLGNHQLREIAFDIAYCRLVMVNVVLLGEPQAGDRRWVLVDAGVAGSAGRIANAAEKRFGRDARAAAIILTHGHFDHVGALQELARRWDVPIYAHDLEQPYLDGSTSYPPPDPSVGGGLMARLSFLYPRGPIDVSRWLRPLPADGQVPEMPGWRWIHTPGHSPGHVSLWRRANRTIIAGDAFITTRQESAYAVIKHSPEMHGPPTYFTPDWPNARASVQLLARLEPERVVTGHGPAMHGADMKRALRELADNFDEIAVPTHGRYVRGRASRA